MKLSIMIGVNIGVPLIIVGLLKAIGMGFEPVLLSLGLIMFVDFLLGARDQNNYRFPFFANRYVRCIVLFLFYAIIIAPLFDKGPSFDEMGMAVPGGSAGRIVSFLFTVGYIILTVPFFVETAIRWNSDNKV